MILDMEALLWSFFGLSVVGLLIIDLGFSNRKAHVLSLKEAGLWSLAWIGTALLFNYGILHFLGSEKAMQFLAGYLIEKSLSVDNIFVFIMIFSYFGVRPEHQPRVLKWGILGAVIMRGILIGAGAVLINQFHWMTYVFGGLLLFTVIKMTLSSGETFDPGDNPLLRIFRKIVPFSAGYQGERFFVRYRGALLATPLLLVIVVIESSDLVFALDSIPAIFAVTTDPFIVYTSNIFAILGLRALYFVVAEMAQTFRFLKHGIILILLFVALKMLMVDLYKIPIMYSLLVIGSILTVSILTSVFLPGKQLPAIPMPHKSLDPKPASVRLGLRLDGTGNGAQQAVKPEAARQ